MRARGLWIILIICLSLLIFSTDILNAERITVKVITESAYVRLKTSIDSMIISQVALGIVLEASEKIGDWYKVALPPDEQGFVVEGYIHSTDVKVVTTQKPEIAQVSTTVPEVQSKKLPVKEEEQVYLLLRDSKVQFGLKFMGGGDYFLIGDLNDYLQGRQDYLRDDSSITEVVGSYDPLEFGYSFGAEFFIDFTPHIGIGIGAGYFQVKKKSEVNRTYSYCSPVDDPDFLNIVETIFPQISAIPLTFNLNFGLPLGSVVKLRLSGGIGYYLGTVVWDYFEETKYTNNKMDWETKSNAVGYQGSLGIDFNLGKSIAFFIEGAGRYVKLEGLSGKLIINENWFGSEITETYENAFLKYLEYNNYLTDEWYPLVSIDENGIVGSGSNNVPSFNSLRGERNAVIDLTGISFRAGFKIRF